MPTMERPPDFTPTMAEVMAWYAPFGDIRDRIDPTVIAAGWCSDEFELFGYPVRWRYLGDAGIRTHQRYEQNDDGWWVRSQWSDEAINPSLDCPDPYWVDFARTPIVSLTQATQTVCSTRQFIVPSGGPGSPCSIYEYWEEVGDFVASWDLYTSWFCHRLFVYMPPMPPGSNIIPLLVGMGLILLPFFGLLGASAPDSAMIQTATAISRLKKRKMKQT